MGGSSSTGPPLYGKGQIWAIPLTIVSPIQAGGGGMLGVDSASLSAPSWAVGTLDQAGHLEPRPRAAPAYLPEGFSLGHVSLA